VRSADLAGAPTLQKQFAFWSERKVDLGSREWKAGSMGDPEIVDPELDSGQGSG